ncbi:MAG: glycogen synthase GlgA [Firmicutes bacterium]|nr:glycogen synthase GlgA [Bacillota bacterium]
MKVLFASSEVYPFVKTGGLADVSYSLPKELKRNGVDIRVILPKYKDIPIKYKSDIKYLMEFNVKVGWRNKKCVIEYLELENVTYYFVNNDYYFNRTGLYGFYDDGERFSFFDKAILEFISLGSFNPDIIQCNDWHTGMIPVLLKEHFKNLNIKTIFTIHNLKYQGIYPSNILTELLNLDDDYYNVDKLEFYGGISFMKGGINFSDIVTTVSKTYSKEIQHSEFGENLHGILSEKKDKLYGIVNGIDYDIYNPKEDKDIFINYDIFTLDKKKKNKIKLQETLNLDRDYEKPVIGMVTRLAHMKGLDLILEVLDDILKLDIQLVILGTGDSYYESILRDYSNRYLDKLSVNLVFDNSLAKKIYAGSDLFLMPSLFEPCGLGQMIALRYGTLPIVRETGGLKDTVKAYNEFTKEGNGFSFKQSNPLDMLYTIKRAIKFYHNKDIYNEIVKNAMNGNYSWKNSSKEYKKLYKKLIENKI